MTETKTRQMKPSGVPWLGDIPAGWDIVPSSRVFSEIKQKAGTNNPLPRLAFRYGGIVEKECEGISDSPQHDENATCTVVHNDVIMINGLNLNYDLLSQRVAIVSKQGVITSAYLAVAPATIVVFPRFAMYLFKGYDARMVFHGFGSGIRKTLKFSDFKDIPFLLPPLPEQRAIADFLDEKCAAIDAIVEEAKSGIEEYAKWKQSVVFQAVTKGLDPHAKMKDSGVEWIGEIPEEWKVAPLRFLTDSYKAGPFGSALITDQLQKTGTILVYTPEHIAKREAELPNNLYLPEERREEMSQFFVKAGDVVFPIVGSLGRALQVTTSMPEGIINQRLAKFRLRSDRIDANYFMWLFAKSEFFKQHIEVVCRGSIIVNLTKSIVGDMPIPLPPLPEQRAIAAYLDEKCTAIDALIEEKKQLIEDLGVYKKSLIYETVTGKRRAG